MMCTRCNNHVVDCTCGDMEERLRELAGHPNFATDRCADCWEHQQDCTCGEYTPLQESES